MAVGGVFELAEVLPKWLWQDPGEPKRGSATRHCIRDLLNMKALHSSNPDKNPTDTFLGFAFAGPGTVFLPSCHGDCPFQVV